MQCMPFPDFSPVAIDTTRRINGIMDQVTMPHAVLVMGNAVTLSGVRERLLGSYHGLPVTDRRG